MPPEMSLISRDIINLILKVTSTRHKLLVLDFSLLKIFTTEIRFKRQLDEGMSPMSVGVSCMNNFFVFLVM